MDNQKPKILIVGYADTGMTTLAEQIGAEGHGIAHIVSSDKGCPFTPVPEFKLECPEMPSVFFVKTGVSERNFKRRGKHKRLKCKKLES